MQSMRSHENGTLRTTDVGTIVTLVGWVQRRRDHGGLIFVDLRDRSGVVQIVFNPEHIDESGFSSAERLRNEYVIAIRGDVRQRLQGMENPNLGTGDIEVFVQQLTVLNEAATPPFAI